MKTNFIAVCLLFLMVSVVHAIGLQHGIFRSQSTQGAPWQGTAEIVREHYDITVYPDYLDVELEWEFKAGGSVPAEYKDALEIVGNFNLVHNSVVVSMITWYKDMILKGKLKTDSVAREQYEKVVERSSDAPPPPRDPVLLELVREDNYDISIFPIEFGKTRQVRIRYLIPAFSANGINKIAYPHAFTENATVSVKAGPGAKGYDVETALEIVPFDDIMPVILDGSKFEFMPYARSSAKASIGYIVPELDKKTNGSVVYCGAFTTDNISGEVSHIITMSADKALLKSSIPQDFVILWRWNHPDILLKYAGQIVRQSKQLIRFLSMLSEHGKRAAMIVSLEGKESITFKLDAPGSDEFRRMIAWLENVSTHTVTEPDLTTKKQSEIQYDFDKSLREFNEAIEAAIALFDSGSSALKQLVLLTAGPKLVTTYSSKLPVITIDSAITLNTLSSFEENQLVASVQNTGDRMESMYWPGVNVTGFLQNHLPNIQVSATIGNGDKNFTFDVLSDAAGKNSDFQAIDEAHLFSNSALKKEIRWRIVHDGSAEEFVETPAVVVMEDGLQYARLIGASRYLYPLANVMPSSIASSVGFVDEKYSLVALEENALTQSSAAEYDKHGVPLLQSMDIFRAPDEKTDIAVADWLVANPPQKMIKSYPYPVIFIDKITIVFDKAVDGRAEIQTPVVPVTANGRIALPAVGPIYAESPAVGYDYTDVLGIKTPQPVNSQNLVRIVSKQGSCQIDLSAITVKELRNLSIYIYDLNGRIIKVLTASLLQNSNGYINIGDNLGLPKGAYIIKLQGKGITLARRIVLK